MDGAEAVILEVLAGLRDMSVMLESPKPEQARELFESQNRLLDAYRRLHELGAGCDNVLIPESVLRLLDEGRHPDEHTKKVAQSTKKAVEDSARRSAALKALYESLAQGGTA